MRAETQADGLFGERHRQQVVQVAVVRTIGKVFAVDADLVLVEQAADLVQQRLVERRGAAERQRQPVTDERTRFGQRAERLAKLAADIDPVFRCDFEEVDRRIGLGPTESALVKRAFIEPALVEPALSNPILSNMSCSGPRRARRKPSPAP